MKENKAKPLTEQIQFKKDMARKCGDTSRKHMYLREFSKNLVVMKECDFDIKFSQTPVHEKYSRRESLFTKIWADKLFVAIVCNVKVPNNNKNYFAEMPPIFKNAEITIDDVGPYM